MLKGWLEAGVIDPEDVAVIDKDPAKAQALSEEFGVSAASDIGEASRGGTTVVLAVKPQDSAAVLEEMSSAQDADKVVISIVAGLSIASIRSRLGKGPSVIRVMPNMGAQVRASISGYAVDPGEGMFDVDFPVLLLKSIGEAVEVEEESLDLVTAVSGSGPAYFFMMAEALEDAAVEQGMPRDVAKMLARETLWGAAKILRETGRDAAELRKAVSSPGGTTLAALGVFEEEGFMRIISRAVYAARKRAGELTQ